MAGPFRELVTAAAGLGATVREDATLADLADSTRSHEIVLLLSHWKGPDVLSEDLIEREASAFARRATDKGDTALSAALSKLPPGAANLTAYLSGLIESTAARPSDSTTISSAFSRRSARRDALDALFGGLWRPGNRLELADGLHAKEAIEAVIATDFRGALDLTTCTSTYLSDHLDRARAGAFRTLQFERPQEPAITCLALEVTLRRLAEGMTYVEARSQAIRDLRDFAEAGGAEKAPRRWFAGMFGNKRRPK